MSNKNAYSHLVKLLSIRDYSEHKLREKLREKKYPPEDIDQALSEVKSKGFLREDFYTEARAKAFMKKGYSVRYIFQKMAYEHLTISEEAIRNIFADHQMDEDQQIERLIQKKIPTHFDSTIDTDLENKILRYLLSKGHDFSRSKKVLSTLMQEEKLF